MSARADRAAAWQDLARPAPPVGRFDPRTLAALPAPARRLLTRALAPGAELRSTVLLAMDGAIKLRTWMPFRARQVLRAGAGFVWWATAGKGPLRFTGGDTYWRGAGTLDFRLWGVVPVARASGTDIDRSAAGRLAAETLAWAPQALTPRMGATWEPVDDDTATVSLGVGDDTLTVSVTVDADGLLRELSTRRWGDPGTGNFDLYPFGGAIDDHGEFGGVTIATVGRVGWWWGTDRQAEGEFFRYRVTDARFV